MPCAAASSYPEVPLIWPARKSPDTRWVCSVGIELGGLDEVVLDRVSRPHHRRSLQARQGVNQFELHVSRQAHRVAVQIDLVDVQTLRLEEQVMALPVGKPHHLVFERRAIARTDALESGR